MWDECKVERPCHEDVTGASFNLAHETTFARGQRLYRKHFLKLGGLGITGG